MRLMVWALTAVLISGTAVAQDGAKTEAAVDSATQVKVKLSTTLGDIVLNLDGAKAPISTDNFVRYAQDGFYNGLIFHRVMKDFMIQGGGFDPELGRKEAGLRDPIENEWKNGLKNKRGTIAMARTSMPNSATAQFFINVVDNDRLDQAISGGAGYAVFGSVVEGMDVVDKIRNTEVADNPKLGMGPVVPTTPVVINKAEVVGEYNREQVMATIEKKKQAEIAAWKEKWPADVKAFVAKQEEELGQKITVLPSGLAYFTLAEGEGKTPGPSSRVPTHYTGWLIDGTKFDSSYDSPSKKPYPVNMRGGVIKGWLLGLKDMKVGGKRKLVIPPRLAYGRRGYAPKIGPDAYLVFDVEVMDIK